MKAIDLESAVSIRSAPKAYTPTALPPDFARATQDGVSTLFSSRCLFICRSCNVRPMCMDYYGFDFSDYQPSNVKVWEMYEPVLYGLMGKENANPIPS